MEHINSLVRNRFDIFPIQRERIVTARRVIVQTHRRDLRHAGIRGVGGGGPGSTEGDGPARGRDPVSPETEPQPETSSHGACEDEGRGHLADRGWDGVDEGFDPRELLLGTEHGGGGDGSGGWGLV